MTSSGWGGVLRQKSLLQFVFVGLVIAVVLVGAGLWASGFGAQSAPVAVEIGAIAPEIAVRKLENGQPGEVVSLHNLRGHPIILNFWATWCEPCQEEFPALDAVYRKYRESKQLEVIGLNVQDPSGLDRVQAFLGQTGVIFPIWLGTDAGVDRTYHVKAMPTTVFIDRSGVIRQIRIGGPLTQDSLEQQLGKIF